MTLEEAIRHAEEVAQKNEDFVRCHSCDRELGFVKRCQKCAEEQRQLAEWLNELKLRKKRMIGIIEIDEKDITDDGYIIVELPLEPERPDGMQAFFRVKTNLKLIEWSDLWNRRVKR